MNGKHQRILMDPAREVGAAWNHLSMTRRMMLRLVAPNVARHAKAIAHGAGPQYVSVPVYDGPIRQEGPATRAVNRVFAER